MAGATMFRGIRYGLGRQGGKELDRPEFISDLKALAAADLVMATANPSVARAEAEKYFWRNSVKCYKCVKRAAGQKQLA